MKNNPKVPVYFITDRCWIRNTATEPMKLLASELFMFSLTLGHKKWICVTFWLCEFSSWHAGAGPSPRTKTPWYIMLTLAALNTMNNTGILQIHDPVKPGSPHLSLTERRRTRRLTAKWPTHWINMFLCTVAVSWCNTNVWVQQQGERKWTLAWR